MGWGGERMCARACVRTGLYTRVREGEYVWGGGLARSDERQENVNLQGV